jgi:hypothetical protein
VVQNTLAAYRFFETGQLEEYWGHDPSNFEVDCLIFYHQISCRIRDKQHEVEEAERKIKDTNG